MPQALPIRLEQATLSCTPSGKFPRQAGGSSSGSSANSRVNIIINGATHNICSSADSKLGDKTVTTVTPDSQKLMEKLAAEANGAVVTIPISGTSENLVASFDGQTLKNMESRNAVIEVKTDGAIFTVPAGEINTDSVSTKLGTSTPLSSITVNLAMVPSSSATELQPTKAAINNGFTTLVQPMNIVNCTYGGKTVSASSYENYVERSIRLPDGIDPNKITTGVIIYADGTVRHVPTKVEIINGAYYASINSLTNGDFSVAYHPELFSDVSGNWAQNVINDMGSRMVVNGVGNNLFEPNRSITRAEFAAIVVRALGLLPGTGNNPFSDVKATAWYADYVETAVSYGIITGYDSDTFGPMDTITCEQAMVMVSRAMKITGLSDNLTSETNLIGNCGDSGSTSSYAVAGIEACLQTGVVSGRFGKLIAPKDPICRAGVAQIIKTCSASRTSSEPFNNRTLPQKPEPPLLDKIDVEAQ